MSAAQRAAPRRERARAATIQEIKQTALRIMRERGTAEIHFADIARAMEMTAPALYRYFGDRDELLGALIADGYDALGRRLAQAAAVVPENDVGGRWVAAAQAYREWARSEPHQFSLVLGQPIPGYIAPEDGPTTEAAKRALSQLSALFVEALTRGVLRPPMIRDVHPAIEHCAMIKNAALGVAIPAETFQAMLHAWSALHGFAALEAHGHFAWMDPPALDSLFAGQVRMIGELAGLPQPLDPTLADRQEA